MTTPDTSMFSNPAKAKPRPFRRAVFRGVAVVLPPLLTIVIFFWVGSTVQHYVLEPVTAGVRDVIVWQISDIRDEAQLADAQELAGGVYNDDGEKYKKMLDDSFVPLTVYDEVRTNRAGASMPVTGVGTYQRYVEYRYLQPYIVVPLFLTVFIILMYLLGRFLAAGIGRVLWNLFERGILQLPLVRNVYSSVKQVTDFMFSESDIEYTRVVAVEYPRKGIWSIALVTGESMAEIRDAAQEPIVSILIPSSPMPVTGYTMSVRKSEVVDLDITIDQAFQFIVSCGVVVPPQQLQAPFANSNDSPPTLTVPSTKETSQGSSVSSSSSK